MYVIQVSVKFYTYDTTTISTIDAICGILFVCMFKYKLI